MAQCRECGRDFIENRPFQVFCDSRCKGAYHRRKYREQAREQAAIRAANWETEDASLAEKGSLAELAEKVREAMVNIKIDIPANATRPKHKCQGCGRMTTNERFCCPQCRMKLFEKYENAQPMKLVRRI
jgi:hypothetical protein